MGRRLNTMGLYQIYKGYTEEFFPKMLAEDSTVSNEDKEKIKNLLSKPFNPYTRRHSALTERNSMARNLYDSGFIKEASSTTTASEEQTKQELQQQKNNSDMS